MVIVVAINGWHLHQLTEQVSEKLGASAFNVSKSTVESLLSQNYKRSFYVFGNLRVPSELLSGKRQMEIFRNSSLEQSVELKLKDQINSRSIILEQNNQSFEIPIPRTEVEQLLVSVRKEVIISSIIILLASLLFFFWLTQKLSRPLNRITETSIKIGEGQFGIQVTNHEKVPGSELKRLVNSINKMSLHLKQLELQKQQLQEQRTTHEVAEIARGLAHSIRNPLHTISLSLDIKPETDEEFENLNRRIKKQIHRIDQHLKNLMVITTHESLHSDSIDLHQMVQTIITEINSQYPHVPIKLNVDMSNSHSIQGVESELHSVISTLITNAAEASSEKASSVQVSITFIENQYCIEVIDTGNGLVEEIKANLFNPHNTNKPYGAGMGLYLSARIVKGRYQGQIQYTENKPCGAHFSLYLNHRVNAQ